MELTEPILREQLNGVLPDDIIAIEILPERNEIDRFGATFYARDRRIMGYTSRMKGFARQNRTHLVEFCQRMIDTLRLIRDDEPLYHWTAALIDRRQKVHGLSTPFRLVGVHPDDYLGPLYSDDHAA